MTGIAPTESRSEESVVLLVDDNATNLQVLYQTLAPRGYKLLAARSGEDAIAIARQAPPDLILLDIMMPGMDGLETCRLLKADTELRNVPVLFLSAIDDATKKAEGLRCGAVDYVTKPFHADEVDARVATHLRISQLERKLRERNDELELANAHAVLERKSAEQERRRADELLHVILPAPTVAELKATDRVHPRRWENVSVLFADIVGFTSYCDDREPEDVLPVLQTLTERFEEIAASHGLLKIKTIGDAFMAAKGLFVPAENPTLDAMRAGVALIEATRELGRGFDLRVGVHTGPVIAGVVGGGRYCFDLWGDTVNTAARMESHGTPGHVTCATTLRHHLDAEFEAIERGIVSVKGKGEIELVAVAGHGAHTLG